MSNCSLSSANGIIWFKVNKDYLKSEKDNYFCITYIPPDGSRLYRNINSTLFEFDFFEQLNVDIRRYSDLGCVFVLGDLNARTGELADYIPSTNLGQYVDLPDDDTECDDLPPRKNDDKQVNHFGSKLLNLCKENRLYIVNGRLENGSCTFHSKFRNKPVCSTIDYIITSADNFNVIKDVCVLDLLDFSDHCPITFALNCSNIKHDYTTFDKLRWDSAKKDDLLESVSGRKADFDGIINKLMTGEFDIDRCVDDFSTLVYDISFKCFGKTCTTKPKRQRKRKAAWFDANCAQAKRDFLTAKRDFANHKSDSNKLKFLECRKTFSKVKRNAKFVFHNKEKDKLSSLSKKSPRSFWKYVKSFNKANKPKSTVSLDEFVKHFSDEPGVNSDENDDSETFTSARETPINIDQLDKHITVEEIQKTIASMSRYKSSDYENNVADFFIDTNAFISEYLCTIFNRVFDTGIYPESWSRGVIVPIYKKGETTDPANYRGITLVNVIAKIFSLVLRNRINKWSEQEKILTDYQYGFRDGKSTADAIFLLHSIVQKVLSNKSKLYCVFIDYQRAFDTINREALWEKLITSGLSCKMVNIVKSIYNRVQSCVRDINNPMNMSDFFDLSLGLKQGEPLSPLLFILFVNDIIANIDVQALTDTDIELLS